LAFEHEAGKQFKELVHYKGSRLMIVGTLGKNTRDIAKEVLNGVVEER